MNPLRNSYLWKFFGIAVLTMGFTMGITAPLIDVPFGDLAADGAIGGVLLGVLWVMLRGIAAMVGHTSLPRIQKAINYTAVLILFLLCRPGLWTSLLFAVFPYDTALGFVPMIPVRAALAVCTFCIIVYRSEYRLLSRDKSEKETRVEEALGNGSLLEKAATDKTVADSGESSAPDGGTPTDRPAPLEHIAVKNGQKIDLVFISDVVALQAEGDYVMIYTPTGRFLKEQTMKYFTDHLPANKFVRVHRSAIINIDYIARVESYEKQQHLISMHNKVQVKANAAGYKALKKALHI